MTELSPEQLARLEQLANAYKALSNATWKLHEDLRDPILPISGLLRIMDAGADQMFLHLRNPK